MEEKKTFKEKAKEHWQKHKVKYYVGCAVIVVGGACYIVGKKMGNMEAQIEQLKKQLSEESVKQIVNVDNSNTIKGDNNTINQNITQQLQQLSRPGNAGDAVYCPQTDKVYPSKRMAEKSLKLPRGMATKLVKGDVEKSKGYNLIEIADWNSDEPRVFDNVEVKEAS